MLQPRPCRLWLLLVLAAAARQALSDESKDELLNDKSRIRRQSDGDVTVLSLEENGRFRESPLGIISSTARTFVNDGATTEFATQIIGTTVGRTYARLLSTGTRVYYDSNRHTKDPFIVFPSIPGNILPTKTPVLYQTAEPVIAEEKPVSLNEISESGGTEKPQPVVSVRKEFSVKRNTDIKPAKVKPKSGLPTVTIKNEFSPSGYSSEVVEEKKEDKKPRGGKGLFRGGVQVKNDFQKYDTVTYVGFADFTTTVGNTVIIFMPKTASQNSGPITSISGAATLRPEDAVVTTVKTFMSHSPGMATKTVTGHNINMETSLPTIQADIRASKAYNPVFSSSEVVPTTEEATTNPPTNSPTTNPPTTNPPTTNPPTNPPTTNQQPTTEQITTEHLPESTTEEEPYFEPSETVIPTDEIKSTESLPILPTYATTKTQVFIPGDQPLGLAKSIAVIEAYDETTTYITSFLFGTLINDEYTQLTQIASSTSVGSEIKPTSSSTFEKAKLATSDADHNQPTTSDLLTSTSDGELEETTTEKEHRVNEQKKPSINYITRIIPSTVYQTYTYFTTFFVPNGDESTSVKSREVVTSEIKYITTSLPPPGHSSFSTISPTEHTTTPQKPDFETVGDDYDITSTTEEQLVAEPTPHLPDPAILSPTTEDPPTETYPTTEMTTTEKAKENAEEEVEVIIKTLYTTYTYLTTFFQETTSSVKSREVVETNVVTTTIDSNFKATDPAVAGLLNSYSLNEEIEQPDQGFTAIQPSPEELEIEPTSTEFLKTYTYYTTVFVDGETLIESHTEVVTESIQPTNVDDKVQFKTASAEDNNVVPRREANNAKIFDHHKRKPSYDTISRPKIIDRPTSEPLVMAPFSAALQSSIDDAYSYDTTMSRDDRIIATQSLDENIPVEDVLSAREEELKKEAMLAIGMTPVLSDDLVETLVTDITSSSSGGIRRPADEYESDPNDQISSESNTEEIEPSRTPTLVLQTSFTTYTYFTTIYKGSSSHVISRLDTVTNIVTETVRPTELEAKLSPEEATLPITYFTTFTYWTTLYKGKSTMITSREETVSNVVTPTLPVIQPTEPVEMTISPTQAPPVINDAFPTSETSVPPPSESPEVPSLETPDIPSSETPKVPLVPATQIPLAPTIYYTTYTYFTTSYIGNETVINSHLETETNVVTPTVPPKGADIVETSVVEVINSTKPIPDLETFQAGLQPTGLISTIRSSEINDGITTLYNTDVYGTYIDGLYAQVLESSTDIVAPTASSISGAGETQPTGVVSINEGKIVDADGISTTLFTTKAVGTYIDDLYAQVIESTTSVIVDEEKKTATPPLPSTTVIGTKTYTTGLVRLIEGSIVKEGSTTYYESRVIGTLIDGRYAQIIESTSSFKTKMESTEMPAIKSTPTPLDGIKPTAVPSISPTSSVIESSQSTTEEEEDNSGTENPNLKPRLNFSSKTKASKASIRPFASRPRPTFQPKRKDPATTITRNSFTPTVTATPASKTKGFGSSRNRFAANRSKSNTLAASQDIKPTSSSARRFSRTRGSSSAGFSANRARPSSSVRPTLAPASSSRRAGFNYRSTGVARPAIGASSARFRIRPTQALGPPKTFASVTTEDINNDINQVSTEEPQDNSTPEEEETPTTSAPTTTESPRRANNPLLRFRRPPILQRASTTTTTSKPTTTAKRSSLLRRPDNRAVVTTTPRSRPSVNFNRKPRPGNSLFPPRGLGRKPANEEPEEKEEEEEEETEDEESEIDIQDNEYEGSEKSEQHSSTTTEAPKVTSRRGKGINIVSIRPFARRPRTKRQVEYGSRGYTPKFRRNKSRTTAADFEDEVEVTPEPTRQTTSSRYQRTRGRSNQNQSQQQRERVRPSPVTNAPRHQFTLRERSQTTPAVSKKPSSYRRTTSSPRRRTEATTVGRIKAPRLRTQTTEASSPRTTSRRFSSTSRGSTRTTSRARYRDNNEFDGYSPPPFDGTITVTHKVPTEVTIPIVNGKNTEYKNVITAKPSLEILGPYQYTTTTKDGKPIIQLTTELTSTLPNGFMEVTKYLVYETPTTSVTFTPTTLRGRKTSFSHIVPSTVYEVRPDVSTVQPNLGNAPLANLLLSQLLLGNLGIPNTAGQEPQSPTTEFKTKTTTYVTTVTSHTSTILPLTFRGKEITTTIVDSSTEVITATEYITETVVITPTAAVPINNQLNTLLLPALLQAQLLQQNTPQPPPAQNNFQQFFQAKDPLNTNDKSIDNDPEQQFVPKDEFDDSERKIREYDDDDDDEITEVQVKPRKKGKIKIKQQKPPDKSTSVVTLYVSGKHPGEFTTLLSTLVLEDTSNIKKREINYNSYDNDNFIIMASRLPELNSSEESSHNVISTFSVLIESSEVETQSQENIQTKHLVLSTPDSKGIEETITGHFLSKGPADSAPEQRTASTRSIKLRNKRDIEELPRRRRIRVRVPVRRYRNETGEEPSESLSIENFTTNPEISVINEPSQNHRRIKVIKKKLDQPSIEPQRKRVLIKKTKAVDRTDNNTRYPMIESAIPDFPPLPKRKRVLVTRKKISTPVKPEPTSKKRLKITRKRPIPTEVPQLASSENVDITPTENFEIIPSEMIEITPSKNVDVKGSENLDLTIETDVTIFADSPMATLYNYHYSIPSDQNEGNVMVSEIFMSGPRQLNPDIDDEVTKNNYSHNSETNTDGGASELSVTQKVFHNDEEITTNENYTNEDDLSSIAKEDITSPPPSQSTSSRKIKIKPFKRIKQPTVVSKAETESTKTEITTEVNLQFETTETILTTTVEDSLEPNTDEIKNTDENEYVAENITENGSFSINEANINDEMSESPPEKPNTNITNNTNIDSNENQTDDIIPTIASENPVEDFSTPIQYHYITKLTTTTRLRTYTYVVTRVSGNEHIVTSSTAIKPDIRTLTVSELVPITKTVSAENEEGRAYYLGEPRYNLATKRMSNGVEVIVAGDKSTLPGQPHMRIVPTGLVRPITLAPSTLTDHMMMLLPQESQKPHNEFVTKTYMTTYTYLTTFAQDGSTVVSSREKVISNVVTEEIKPSKTKVKDHFTLTASPDLTTGVYHTTYTYLNTLVDGELPLVVTSKKTVANTVTEQPSFIQPSEVPLQDTNTYLSTVAYTRTVSEGDNMQIVSTEDVLTQVVITESDFLPSAIEEQPSTTQVIEIKPTPITTDITKTYFATYTYYNTKVNDDGQTTVETEVVTSSDIATETFTLQPKRPKPIESSFEITSNNNEVMASETQPLNLFATKTYLTTFTYFTTLLQENKSPSIVVSSNTEVRQNIVTETVNPSLLDPSYLDELRISINDKHEPVITTATLNGGEKMEITAMGGDMLKMTDKVDVIEATPPTNVVTGSTIIFFDEADQIDSQSAPSKISTPPQREVNNERNEYTTMTSLTEDEEPTNPPSVKVTEEQNSGQIPETASTPNKKPVKNILQFSSLGINSLNALGPVINAMADLFQSKFNTAKKNATIKPQPVYKPSTEEPPRPVYNPLLDSEVAESQNIEGHNVFVDAHQRTRQTERPNIETALLSGGIPISPGQVITTNSDVIIGKPAVHGPRPPVKHFQKEVEGMKPPPPPSKGIWQNRDQERYPSGHIPVRIASSEKLPPRREQSKPQNFPPHKQMNSNNYIDLRHEGTDMKIPSSLKSKPHDSVPQSSKPIDVFQKPFISHKVPIESHRNRRPSLKDRPQLHPHVYPDDTTDLRPPVLQTPARPPNYISNEQTPYIVTKDTINSHEIDKPFENANGIPTSSTEAFPIKAPEPTYGHPLLVNIQPSQVANVIIPHGVSTALIYNKEPEIPSQKGEIFNEPSPYPDAEVGIGGVAGLAKPDDEVLHAAVIPSNAVRMDVPVSPQGISADPITRIHKDEKKKLSSHPKKPIRKPEHHFPSHGLNYMTPPPPPAPALINYHFSGKQEVLDQEGEYSLKNEYHTEDDDFIHGFDIEPAKTNFHTNKDYKNNEDVPITGGIQVIPPTHFSNYSDSSEEVSFSVINSKPVILGSDTPENQAPIIKGRPGVSAFVNNSEATVSVGQMTNLQPKDDLDIPSNPLYNVHSTAIIRKPQPLDKQNRSRPFDNTVYTMNMDERPPLQAFGASPQKINYDLSPPLEMELTRLTPHPGFDRSPESNVMGLTPPAISRLHEPVTIRPNRRPPIRKRPVPPYKFEIPVAPLDRLKKPVLHDIEQPPPPPVPTEVLSPPKQSEETFLVNENDKPIEIMNIKQFTTAEPTNISPVLRGSLKVEELQQKPEVITADSKVTKLNPTVSGSTKDNGFTGLSANIGTPSPAESNTIMASHANELVIGSEILNNDDAIHSKTQELPISPKSTVDVAYGSTTIYVTSSHRPSTPRPTKVTNTVQSHRTVIPLHINPVNDSEAAESSDENEKVRYNNDSNELNNYSSVVIKPFSSSPMPTPTTHIITHTQTLTVTTTESRVIQSKGQKPSTHTLVVTKTHMSTILDTVTEVHTILKPTSILSTVTTTIPQATTTVYPTTTTQKPYMETGPSNKDKHPVNHQATETRSQNKNNLVENNKAYSQNNQLNLNDNDSILVVMTDKNTNHKLDHFDKNLEPALEIESSDVETNDIAPNVLLSGLLSQYEAPSQCKPECRVTRNEICQNINSIMRCVCRPGFARMFADQPCKPTYTYSMTVPLERKGKDKFVFSPFLQDNRTSAYQQFAEMTKDGLDRMVMQSDLRDLYHGLAVTGFQRDNDNTLLTHFYIQLSENIEEEKIMEQLKKYLTSSNYSMGGTDLYASKSKIEHLKAMDFDECSDPKFHDCSENAQCFNLRATYTCSCKEGFTDLSHNTLYPGRVCSADMIGCERCNYHGNCYLRNNEEEMCECFHWYAGQYCQINLKVLLLILVLVGVSLGVLLVVCLVLSCMKQKPRRVVPPGFRLRPPPPPDKRAMINVDTASEASIDPPPFINQPPRIERPTKPCRKPSKAPSPPVSFGGGTLEQRDRSLTVMIPRAKYRPVPGSNLLTMSTFGPEQKLLKYLTPEKQGSRPNSRKPSNSTNHSHESTREHVGKKPSSPHLRKPSTGALVSAGFEVSATVGRTKELQECFITEPHTDLGQPGFSTIRTADSSIIVDIPPPPTLEAELLDTAKVDLLTVSEVRSYDETTVHPATKSLRINYDKNDDSHTMVERDIGSTFIMPQSQLFKPARSNGSDISNFDSL